MCVAWLVEVENKLRLCGMYHVQQLQMSTFGNVLHAQQQQQLYVACSIDCNIVLSNPLVIGASIGVCFISISKYICNLSFFIILFKYIYVQCENHK